MAGFVWAWLNLVGFSWFWLGLFGFGWAMLGLVQFSKEGTWELKSQIDMILQKEFFFLNWCDFCYSSIISISLLLQEDLLIIFKIVAE